MEMRFGSVAGKRFSLPVSKAVFSSLPQEFTNPASGELFAGTLPGAGAADPAPPAKEGATNVCVGSISTTFTCDGTRRFFCILALVCRGGDLAVAERRCARAELRASGVACSLCGGSDPGLSMRREKQCRHS